MNCKKVEELLPLYVGRDLTEENARLVTTHLHGCTQCALSAREYGEANQLLQMFEPPQFSDAAYAAVRSSVWREIERKSSAPRLIEFFKRPLPLHVTWAVSLAVMVVVGAFAYYFLADRMSQQGYRQPLAATGGPGKQNPPDEPLNTGTVASGVDRSLNGLLAPPAPANGSRKPRLNRPKLNLTIGLVSHSWKAGGSSTPAGLPGRGPRTPDAVPVTAGRYSAVEPKGALLNTSATSDKTLRLELQTSDPNIRIIWFSHPSNSEGSPHESSKGT